MVFANVPGIFPYPTLFPVIDSHFSFPKLILAFTRTLLHPRTLCLILALSFALLDLEALDTDDDDDPWEFEIDDQEQEDQEDQDLQNEDQRRNE